VINEGMSDYDIILTNFFDDIVDSYFKTRNIPYLKAYGERLAQRLKNNVGDDVLTTALKELDKITQGG
jgi:hypothetical protein